MELDKTKVFKVETMTVTEFAKVHGNGCTSQAIYYAMDNDKIDYTRMGSDRLVVMTDKTKLYVPNENKNRDRKRTTTMQTGRSAAAY